MILVDKEIKQRILNGELISSGYDEGNVSCVSYDLTVDCIIMGENEEKKEYDLAPGETVFIKTKEQLNIPNDILGRIAEKNSRMRQGFKVDGPHYQPGHNTYGFLRVQNISSNILSISSGNKIAQIIFEQLTQEPDNPYNSTFQNENKYKGMGIYENEYSKQIKNFESVKEDIENLSHNIYTNVLTFMGIIVAIFSLISINYQAFTNTDVNFKFIIAMNLSLTFCISVLMGLILIFVNKAKSKGFIIFYSIILGFLAVGTIVFGIAVL